jgi:SAM-dependent methyltransferase
MGMKLKELQRNWEMFGRTDPYWAVLTDPARKGGRWNEDEFYQTGVRDVDRLMTRLERLQLPHSRGRALDFGCGVGRVALALAPYFDEVTGVDIAPAMLAAARRRDARGTCRFILNTAPDLSAFASRSFDLIHCRLVLQHIPPEYIRTYVREFVRVARRGGVILFQLPTPSGFVPSTWSLLRITPPPVVRLIRRTVRMGRHLLRLPGAPVMDDYGLSQEETASIITSSGGRLLEVRPDQSHGTGRPGYEYLVTIPA